MTQISSHLIKSLGVAVFLSNLSISAHAGRDITYLEQGWTDVERDAYYKTAQGSKLIPRSFYFALEQANSHRLFSLPGNVQQYKYIYDVETYGQQNLPIGFAIEPQSQGEDWIGMSCSACHTNEIRYKQQSVRVDGAPSLADFNGFVSALSESVRVTLANEDKFTRFARRIYGENLAEYENLRTQLTAYQDYIGSFVARNELNNNSDYGRVDAFGIIMNELFVDDMHYPANRSTPNAPVSYPFLWNTPSHDYVQWNGSGSNPLGRNVAEVLGTFGSVNLTDFASFGKTSARGKELVALENLISTLAPPKWPEDIFGKIDQEKALAGKAIYEASRSNEPSCVSCHALKDANGLYPMTPPQENAFGVQFVDTSMIALNEIGTDPGMAVNFAARTVSTAHLASYLPAPYTGAAQLPAPVLLGILAGIATKSAIADISPPLTQPALYSAIGYRVAAPGYPAYGPENLLAYRAQPLDGIWATAPYLHNGSVQNLYELLLPVVQRKASFQVGSRWFEPEKVGFISKGKFFTSTLDTSKVGNANTGHEYGTALTTKERWQLLEFLKTL